MAENQQNSALSKSMSNEISSRIQALRALAQSNLTSIEAEDAEEKQRQANAHQAAQRYIKIRTKDRPKARADSPPPSTVDTKSMATESLQPPRESSKADLESKFTEKKPRFRPAQDIMSRLQHDPTFRPHISEYQIGYLERFEGMKEMPASSWINESTDEDWIPMHRVKYVVRINSGEREVVWDREERIDLIFGSGRPAFPTNHLAIENERDHNEEQDEAGGVVL